MPKKPKKEGGGTDLDGADGADANARRLFYSRANQDV